MVLLIVHYDVACFLSLRSMESGDLDDLTGSEWLEKLQQSHIVIRQILFTRMIQRQECQINKKVFGLL
ncbi:hypothetical protein ACS0TY_006272 [Phlomoides rotata]